MVLTMYLFLCVAFVLGAWNGRGRCDDGFDARGDGRGPRGVLFPGRSAAQEVPRHGVHRGHVQGLGKEVTNRLADPLFDDVFFLFCLFFR